MHSNKKIVSISLFVMAIVSLGVISAVSLTKIQQSQKNTAEASVPVSQSLTTDFDVKDYFISSNKDVANQENNTILYPRTNNSLAYIGSGNTTNTYFSANFKNIENINKDLLVEASLVLTSPISQWIPIDVNAYVENSLNPNPVTKLNPISSRIGTKTATSYKNDSKWLTNKEYRIDITASVMQLLLSGNPSSINVIVKNNSTHNWARKFFNINFNSKNGPYLELTFKKQLPISSPTDTGHDDHGTTPTDPDIDHLGSTDSMSMGLWTPTKWDDCPKELHDSYFVIAPDGKRYPTWHPTVVVNPATGKECSFGHEHGLDPKLSPFWDEIKRTYYYDENKNGVMDPHEEEHAGLPFGYVNEQMDNWQQGTTDAVMRHEDHVGHKVTYITDVKPWANNPNTSDRDLLGVTCSFLQKIHQGTHSKDAFTNNLHEVMYIAKCSNGYSINTAFMGKFGASGEFSSGLPCEPRGQIINIGKDSTNSAYPGETGRGFREITTYECAKQTLLVPDGQFSGHPYELWSLDGSPLFTRTDGSTIINGISLGFAVFDPIRMYKPGAPNNIGYLMDLCYETEANGDAMRGSCYATNYGQIKDITWDDPRSDYKGVHRDTYAGISNSYNAGKPTTYYCNPFGQDCETTYFKGAVKNTFAAMNVDWSKDYGNNYPIDPYGFGGDINYDPTGKVHAPN